MKFDDIITDEYGSYTQVCKKCFVDNNLKSDDEGAIGFCEVEDCMNEAHFYIGITSNIK